MSHQLVGDCEAGVAESQKRGTGSGIVHGQGVAAAFAEDAHGASDFVQIVAGVADGDLIVACAGVKPIAAGGR